MPFSLAAQHFAMQTITFEVADDLPVEIDLVQMAAAVMQAIELPAIRHLGLREVAEFVLVMLQRASRRVLAEQLTHCVLLLMSSSNELVPLSALSCSSQRRQSPKAPPPRSPRPHRRGCQPSRRVRKSSPRLAA
jgi:hypothetical protein